MLGQLDGHVTDTAARAEDHDAVTLLEVEPLEPLQSRDARHCERACLFEREPIGNAGDVRFRNRDVLGEESALRVTETPAVDPIADRELLHTTSDGDDGACAIGA